MFDLFRFLLVRPPQELSNDKSISSDTNTDFQRTLLNTQRRSQRKAIATDFIKSANFVKGFADLTHGEAFRQAWERLEASADPDIPKSTKIIKDTFAVDPKDLVGRDTFKRDRDRTADSLVAAKIVSRGTDANLRELVAVLRLITLVERVVRDDAALKQPGAIKEAINRKIRVPGAIANAPDTRDPQQPPRAEQPPPNPRVKELQDKASRLDETIRMLAAIPTTEFVGAAPERRPPLATDITRDEMILRIRDALGPSATLGPTLPTAAETSTFGVRMEAPEEPEVHPLAVRPRAFEKLPQAAKTILQERNIDLGKMSLVAAVAQLEAERDEAARSLSMMEAPERTLVKAFGNVVLEVSAGGPFLAGDPKPSHSAELFSNLRPSGTADLLVVKQQIKRYEAGEVAHIENVLKGEANEHTVRRARTTEETQLQETETLQEEERDLQSTEHFELKNEVDKTVKEDASLKAGVALSGSYGGMIDFKTYVDGSLSTSIQEATKQSSAYAKDVTTRAATKVSQRIRQQITRRTIEEFEETTKHSVNNANGTGHVIGVYQWVDKIYEAQVWNYGLRLLFDIIVPEPAAFFINALAEKKSEGEALEKPIPFTLNPSQITETNYHTYVARYGATGIEAPPPTYRTVAKTFDERSDNANPKTKAAELTLEAGYKAISGVVRFSYAFRDSSFWRGSESMTCFIGDKRFGGGFTNLSDEEMQLAVGLFGYKISDFTATFEVTTKRTDVRLDAWKLKTHGAIQQAYFKAVSDYEQKLANLKAQTAGIQGHNPARNRAIEKTELKRSALAIITQRVYESFDAIDEFSPGAGQPDLFTADPLGKYVRFFEQAFEWEQIMYVFYPYFWGRTNTWQQRLLFDDADPQFADFLQAGWARVTIPVRPWFEKAVAHYIETGEIWDGGDVPDINSPLYVSILTEVEERLNRPGEEVRQGDPWDVRLPTTLVRLRPDSDLPKWKKQQDGTWVPEN